MLKDIKQWNAFLKIKYELVFSGVLIVAPVKHVCDKFDEQLIWDTGKVFRAWKVAKWTNGGESLAQ